MGAIKNAALAAQIYPGWVCRFYLACDVPEEVAAELAKFESVEIITQSGPADWRASFWRFRPACEPDVAAMICRDTDSRLNMRERAAVDAWLDSPRSFHIMRDHPRHQVEILAGLWGVKRGRLAQMSEWIKTYVNAQDAGAIRYGIDQRFLQDVVYPIVKQDVLVHDEIFQNRPFPTPRRNYEYVGRIYEADDSTRQGVDNLLVQFLAAKNDRE